MLRLVLNPNLDFAVFTAYTKKALIIKIKALITSGSLFLTY